MPNAKKERIFKNATLVLPNEVILGSLVTHDGYITEISTQTTSVPEAEDLEKSFFLPGLIELHTDNLERHCLPRPGVNWPYLPAVLSHDAELAASGITTVFDAITLGGNVAANEARANMLLGSANTVREAVKQKLLRIDHYLHLRCEVPMPNVLDLFHSLKGDPLVRLVSLMDHTPGERQFVDKEKQRVYYQGKYALTDSEFEQFIKDRKQLQIVYSTKHRTKIAQLCISHGLIMATHDDATTAHIDEAVELGATISEFPTTIDAAQAARASGMKTVLGAPNVVRGGSHSGNASASDLAEAGLVDALSSDYAPSSLLHAAFLLYKTKNISLPDAISTVSSTPAKMAGFSDRGSIEVGLRADLIQVHLTEEGTPLVRRSFVEGKRVS